MNRRNILIILVGILILIAVIGLVCCLIRRTKKVNKNGAEPLTAKVNKNGAELSEAKVVDWEPVSRCKGRCKCKTPIVWPFSGCDISCGAKCEGQGCCYQHGSPKDYCENILTPAMEQVKGEWSSQACNTILLPAWEAACIAMFGGPEDVPGDVYCSASDATAVAACNYVVGKAADQEAPAKDVAKQICKSVFS